MLRRNRVGQHQGARDRFHGQPREPLQDRVDPLVVACQRGRDQRGLRAGPVEALQVERRAWPSGCPKRAQGSFQKVPVMPVTPRLSLA